MSFSRIQLNGAELLSDASTAQIMLVDTTTRQGRQFIRDWGTDSNVTVLNFPWVEKCLGAKRPLLEEDTWGGCLAQDDGRPIDCGEGLDGAVEEDRQKSVLVTSLAISFCLMLHHLLCKKRFADTSRDSRRTCKDALQDEDE
jgi:hypothetical protein